MTLFIRNKKNQTIVDLELWIKNDDNHEYVELSVSIDIENYSIFLLTSSEADKPGIIAQFSLISELRGWLWEKYFSTKENTKHEYSNVLNELRKILRSTADEFNLIYVED